MDNLKNMINILKALSDENRLRIVLMLYERPMCVCEINDILNIALSTISAHLKTLKYAGLIIDNKNGRWVEYQLTSDKKIVKLIESIKYELLENETIRYDINRLKIIDRFTCKF